MEGSEEQKIERKRKQNNRAEIRQWSEVNGGLSWCRWISREALFQKQGPEGVRKVPIDKQLASLK